MSPAAEAVRILATLLAVALLASLGVIAWTVIRGVWRKPPQETDDE